MFENRVAVDFGQPENTEGLVFVLTEIIALPRAVETESSVFRLPDAFDFAFGKAALGLDLSRQIDFRFGSDAPAEKPTLIAAGFGNTDFGQPEIRLLQSFLRLAEFVGMQFGRHLVFNRNRVLLPIGWDGAAFGKPRAANVSATVRPASWDGSLIGGASVSPFFIAPRSISPLDLPFPKLANVRYDLLPLGWDSSVFGACAVWAMRRTVYSVGWNSLVVGRHWPAFGMRRIAPDAWQSSVVGLPEFGGGVRILTPRSIAPRLHYRNGGLDYAVDGEWEIPNDHNGYVVRSVGEFGLPETANANRAVLAAGFDAAALGAAYVAGDIQRIETRGWDSLSAGDAVYWSMETVPRGWGNPVMVWWQGSYWRSAWRDHDWVRGLAVFSTHRPVFADGLDEVGFGYPALSHSVRKMSPYGWDSLGIDNSTYPPETKVSRPETLRMHGWDSSVFGRVRLRNTRLFVAESKGFDAAVFGRAALGNASFAPAGWDALVFGLAGLGGGKFQGWDSAAFGYVAVSLRVRTLNPRGFDAERFGSGSLKLSEIVAHGFGGAVFGDVYVYNRNRTVSPAAVEFLERVSPFALVWNRDGRSAVSGFDMQAVGSHGIQLLRRSVFPEGWLSAKFPIHDADFLRRYILVSLGNQWVSGIAQVSQTPKISARGWDGLNFRQPEIRTNRRSVFAGAGDHLHFGRHGVDFGLHKVSAGGADCTLFGTVWLSHRLRHIVVLGTDSFATGRAWVSFGRRVLAPDGLPAPDFGQPEIGISRHVSPVGWDGSDFGGRIIPEILRVEVLRGTDGLDFGTAWLSALVRGIAPFGWDNQADGFGRAEVWPWRRYVYQVHDDLGGLAPLVQSGYTTVYNADRTIGVFGIAPPFLPPFHLLQHGARAVLPAGWDNTDTGLAMAAFRIRPLHPETWDGFVSTQWAVVHNAARTVAPSSVPPPDFRLPEIRNANRFVRFAGAHRDFGEYGMLMVDFAIRSIGVFGTVSPPPVGSHTVFNAVQYIRAKGWESYKTGGTEIRYFRNEIFPKWAHKSDFVGLPDVRNVTPELHFFGADMAYFGTPKAELLRRFVLPEWVEHGTVGRAWIGDRTKRVAAGSIQAMRFGTHRVWHLTTPLHYSRVLEVEGIPALPDPAGSHFVRDNILRPVGISGRLNFGKPDVWCGLIYVEVGIGSDFIGKLDVRLTLAAVSPKSLGDFAAVSDSRVSPHTLWARPAPPQAVRNHGNRMWHDVDAYSGKGVGHPSVRPVGGVQPVRPYGWDGLWFGRAALESSLRFVAAQGWHSLRAGWHAIGDGRQRAAQFDSEDYAAVGTPRIGFPDAVRENRLLPRGWDSAVFRPPEIALLNRAIAPKGLNSLTMGYSRGSRPEYMPQSLTVYFPLPVIPEAWDGAVLGQPEISLWVRNLTPAGFDGFASEYDIRRFKDRMRVRRGQMRRNARRVLVHGWQDGAVSWADIRNAACFIRPDGWADGYHKGVHSVSERI